MASILVDPSTGDFPRQLAHLVQPIASDLSRRLDPRTPSSEVITQVTAALRELNTSVWIGALPDMATKLAEHRLHNKPFE